MALKSGIVSCMRRALGVSKPALTASPALNTSQSCHLSTSSATRLISHRSPLLSANHVTSNIYNHNRILALMPQTACCAQVRDYHSVLRPRLHCKGCYFVWRHGRKYVECSDVPSHKQMKKVITRKLWKEDYTKGNVRRAMNWNRDLVRISDRMCDRDMLKHNWLASRIGKDV